MPRETTAYPKSPIVAFFAANPSSLSTLDLEGEIQAIMAELDAVGLGGVLRFIHRPATTPTTLQRALLVEQPTIVHFSGHGRGAKHGTAHPRDPAARDLVFDTEPHHPSGILLQDDDDEATVKIVSGEVLGDLFAKTDEAIGLVFLNACHSAEQAAAIAEQAAFVIGVDGAITDGAARVFAVALYRALALGRTVKAAFDLGVNALMLEGLDADADLPILRTREGADPTSTRLVPAPKADDGESWDVFVSYASADRREVHRLALELHERHLRVFFDEWEIGAGDRMTRRLEEGVDGSLHGIVAISPNTMAGAWGQEEYAALLHKAVTQRRRLIPVLIGKGEAELPPFLRTRRCVDLRSKTGDAYRKGVESIAGALRGQRPGPPPRGR